jgi:RNase P subunit RPR2
MSITVDGVRLICCRCKQPMWVPIELHTAAKSSEKIIFFCAYGHEQHFPKRESEEHKLRRERDRYLQQLAEREDRIREMHKEQVRLRDEANKARIARRKVVDRISKGVCPCCNRSFVQLARHMKTQHPLWERFGETAGHA